MNKKDWREEHGKVIAGFLKFLNSKTHDFVLKGGTSLMTCYNLDRFSEDIDLDSRNKHMEPIVKEFCDLHGYSYRVAKDTDTVKRYMIHYNETMGKPLKIEISYRRREIDPKEVTIRNGITVYNIDTLCIMKTNAYSGRDKIRDLYDVSFICNNYFDELSEPTKSLLRTAIEYKGMEQFDYIVEEQHDELIDEGKLAEDFLRMYEKLDLMYNNEEKQIAQDIKENALMTHAAESEIEQDRGLNLEEDWER